jgi:hypothetical protein
VNRIYSPFGSGWWLNGLESITRYGSLMLWIGGDDSTRIYRPTGTDWGPRTAEYSNGVDSMV